MLQHVLTALISAAISWKKARMQVLYFWYFYSYVPCCPLSSCIQDSVFMFNLLLCIIRQGRLIQLCCSTSLCVSTQQKCSFLVNSLLSNVTRLPKPIQTGQTRILSYDLESKHMLVTRWNNFIIFSLAGATS